MVLVFLHRILYGTKGGLLVNFLNETVGEERTLVASEKVLKLGTSPTCLTTVTDGTSGGRDDQKDKKTTQKKRKSE